MEQLYFYPPDGEDPSPMYEGLRTNLPYVSDAKATWARDKRTSFGLLATACPVSVLGRGGASR